MFKKIASIALAATMLTSAAAIAASAAEDDAAVGAEAEETVGAEAEESTGAGNTISFDTNGTWGNFKYAMCYIWEYGGSAFADWGAKATRMTDDDGDGIWTFDLDKAGITFDSSKEYAVIFSNDNNMQTYDLLVGADCIGDTAYCDGTTYENPQDSSKTATAAFWKGQDKSKYGPVFTITSIGNVVGTCIRPSTTKYKMFVEFLKDGTYANAVATSGKTSQQVVDDTATALELKKDDVTNAIKESGATVEWDASKSSLAGGSNESSNSGSSSNSSSNNSSSSSNTSSNSSSTTKSTTTNSVSSGQETTIFFVFAGVMLAAAGVIFLARKKREE